MFKVLIEIEDKEFTSVYPTRKIAEERIPNMLGIIYERHPEFEGKEYKVSYFTNARNWEYGKDYFASGRFAKGGH